MDRTEILLQLKNLKNINVDVPGFNKLALRDGEFPPHQAIGVSFLTVAKKGMLLDPVGSGKTVMAIAADLKLRSIGNHSRTLIGCLPNSREQWFDEYRKWAPNLSVCQISGQRADRYRNWLTAHNCDVSIAAYETVRADVDIIESFKYGLAVWDEGSYFKNPETRISEVLERLRDQFDSTFILTATPIQKSLVDLFSILLKLDPTIIGMDLDQFIDRYVVREKIPIRGRNRFFWKVTGYKNETELASTVFPHYLKRSREELFGDTLKRQRIDRKVALTAEQVKEYIRIVDGAPSPFEGDAQQMSNAKASLFECFMRLEQCCDNFEGHSGKLDDLMFQLTNDLADEKVVVFSKFHHVLDELQRRLVEEGIGFVRLTGREGKDPDPKFGGESERAFNRKKFFEDVNSRICLITTSAEMGLNLHAASYMVFLNHVWNPQREEQIFGRIDRPMVQKASVVTAIHYSARNTIEDRLLKKMESERALFEKVFGEGVTSALSAMSASQLYELIKTSRFDVA